MENRKVEFIRNNIHYLWIVLWLFGIDRIDILLKAYLPQYLENYSRFFSFFALFNIMMLLIAIDFPFFSRFNIKPKRFLWSNLIMIFLFIAITPITSGITFFASFLSDEITTAGTVVLIVGILLYLIGCGFYFVQKSIDKGDL